MQLLYIIQIKNTNIYKIGVTKNLNKRLSDLQVGNPNELILIKLWKHPQVKKIQNYERILHNYYKKCGCWIRGEWFNLKQIDINYLSKPNTIDEQNQLIEDIKKMM